MANLLSGVAGSTASTPTPTTSTVSATNSGGVTSFDDNILGNYNAPTYHLRFYTIAEQFSTTTQSTAASPSQVTATTVIIAESGVTGYNIKDCQITQVVAGTKETRNTSATSINFTINEPNGTSFLDAMYAAVSDIGVKNWQKADFYLDVSFKGYNEDGSLNTNLCSNFPNSGTWTFKLNIKNVTASLTAQGSSYYIEGLQSHDFGLDPYVGRVRRNAIVMGQTFGDFLDDFASKLNTQVMNDYPDIAPVGGSGTIKQLYTYSFQTHPVGSVDPRSFNFVTSDDPTQSHRGRGFLTGDRGKISANFGPGQLISDIIRDAIGATVEGPTYAISADGVQRGDLGNGSARAAGVFRVYPEVTNIGYDASTNSYIKNIVYHIKMYQSQKTTLRTAEVVNDNGTETIQTITGYNGLRKRYDYLFTGLNTEVIDFDVKFNFTWTASLPAFNGFAAWTENYEQPASYNNYQSQMASLVAQDSQIDATAINQAAATQTVSAQSIGGQGVTGAANTSTTTAYAENLIDIRPSTNPFQVSVRKGAAQVKESAGTGFINRFDRRRSIFATIMQQDENTTSFSKITIRIKGDPFWLGISWDTMLGVTTSSTTATNTNSSTTTSPLSGGALLPDYSAGDNFFALYIKFPYTQNENGAPIMKDDNTFSGLYSPYQIISSFENGIFTQTLEATRLKSVTPAQAQALRTTSGTSTSTATPAPAATATTPDATATSSVGGFGSSD